MSECHKFYTAAKRTLKKAAAKTEELAECAALKLKCKGLQFQLEEQYEKLGALTYRAEKGEECAASEKEELLREIDELLARIEELNQKANAKKSADAEAEPEEDAACQEPDDAL